MEATIQMEPSISRDLKGLISAFEGSCDNILSISMSISSAPSLDMSDIPAFSSVHSTPYRGLGMLDSTFFKSTIYSNLSDVSATVSIPTGPRLKNILVEKQYINNWVAKVHRYVSRNLEERALIQWIPETSTSYLPRSTQTKLQNFRRTPTLPSSSVSGPKPDNIPSYPLHPVSSLSVQPALPSHPPPSPPRPASSRREAHVFDCEISMPGRVSFEVTQASMHPQLVDLMCQLNDAFDGHRDLNLTKLDKESMRPPTLMVSNSTVAIPISLSSSQILSPTVVAAPPKPALPLAIRRGRTVPPAPLKISKILNSNVDAYPGIPTAFLGDASTDSPTFQFASSADNGQTSSRSVEMQLEEMIADLRARASALPAGRHMGPSVSPADASGSDTTLVAIEDSSSGSSYSSRSSDASESDGWAPVYSVLESYHHDSDSSGLSIAMQSSPESSLPWTLGLPSPPSEACSSVDLDTRVTTRDAASVLAMLRGPSEAATPPVSVGEDQGFDLSALPPSRLSVPPRRGILKSTKVVRFVDLPSPPEEDHGLVANRPDPVCERIPAATGITTLPRRPSPLRQSTTPPSAPSPHLRPGPPGSPYPVLKFILQHTGPRSAAPPVARRSLPVAQSSLPATANRRHTLAPHPQFMKRPAAKAPGGALKNGRYPPVAPLTPRRGKENRNRPPPTVTSARTSFVRPCMEERDENVIRGVGHNSNEVTTAGRQKGSTSRMSAPFKSLLGRLKA